MKSAIVLRVGACYLQGVKRFFRWVIRAAVAGALLCAVLYFLKDTLLKSYLERRISQATGITARIEKLHWELRNHTLTLRNFKLYNAAEFGGGPFLDFPEVNLEFVRSELVSGKLHLKRLQIHLAEVHLVKNLAGKFNVEFADEDAAATEAQEPKSNPALDFAGIDHLQLTLGKIVYTDLQNSANDAQYDLGVKDEVIKDVRTESDFTNWLLAQLMAKDLHELTRSLKLDSAKNHKRDNPAPTVPATNAPSANRIMTGPAD